MRAVDTNVLVRLLTGDDPRQTVVAEAFIQAGAWVSLVVLAETIWVLDSIYQKKAAEIVTAIEMLLNHTRLVIEQPDVVSSALELFRSRRSVQFSDCLILERARKAGHLPLGTLDRNLGKVEGTVKL